MTEISTEIIVDARGLRCPWPVLRTAKALREGEEGASLRIMADDPQAETELGAFAAERNYNIIKVSNADNPCWRLAPK